MRYKCFLLFFIVVLTAGTAVAQEHKKFIGDWEGVLNAGIELRVIFHIRDNGKNGLTTTADSPDQAIFDIPCDTTTVQGAILAIEMKSMNASFSGSLLGDSIINGEFKQGVVLPLQLKKGLQPSRERKRLQTPQPPFPYKSEDVEYNNKDKSLRYGATITLPLGSGPYPTALLITGSGPQNRDEEIMGHKLFAVLADHLTRKGYIVLRVDDRGIGTSTGQFDKATSADFANDVRAGINYLLSRPEVDKKKIGLIGHSEGGMIAPIVASQRKDIDFIVLMAAPGIPIIDLMTEQNAAILRSAGISSKGVSAYTPVYKKTITQILHTTDSAATIMQVQKTISDWADTTDPQVVKELGLELKENRDEMALTLAKAMLLPWFKYFLAFDPAPYLQKLNSKVLAIAGDKDIQVIASSNLAGITASLKKSKAKNVEIRELKGLNHLFQTCKNCTIEEYSQLEETISPVALMVISDWLDKHVK